MTRIMLTEEDFRTLVTGGTVTAPTHHCDDLRCDIPGAPVEVALEDVGYHRLEEILTRAWIADAGQPRAVFPTSEQIAGVGTAR